MLGLHSEIKPKRRREIYEDVADMSQPGGSFYIMVALSTVIAAYGLLIDSAAVVVGAMLVAPLMGPIFGIALALASGSRRLLWSSLQSEIFGIVIAIGVGVVIGLAPFRMPIGAEWLVRTQPTLYDLAIALASGLAGAYALVDERMSPALPGVAISVAVLPPLAACGLAASAGRWDMAGGALMLFIANFFAIQIAAAVVFSIFGMLRVERDPRARIEDEEGLEIIQFLKRFWVSILVLLVMGAFMTNTLIGLAVDRRLATTIEDTLGRAVGTISGARISQTAFERQANRLRVTATVLTPRPFESDQVASMETDLENAIDRNVHLIVRSLISRDVDREGTVFSSEEDEELEEEERQRLEFLQRASQIITEHLRDIPGAELTDLQRNTPNGTTVVTAVVRAPKAIGPAAASEIERALRRNLPVPLDLIVRTVLIRETTSTQFLHADEAALAREQEEALASAVRTVLDSWLSDNIEGAAVDQVRVRSLDPRELTVTVLAPRAPTQDEAGQMRDALRAVIGPAFELTIQYELGGRLSTLSGEASTEDDAEASG